MNTEEIAAFTNQCVVGLADTSAPAKLYGRIVNTPFSYRRETTLLGLGIIVLLLTNKADGTIDRVALSKTEHADGAQAISVKKFEDIQIPLDATDNILVQAVLQDEYKFVTDWKYMFIPTLTAEEARLNQAGAAIDCSVIYPLSNLPSGGCMIFSYFEPMGKLTTGHHRFMSAYSAASADALLQRS